MTLITKPDFTYVWASGGAIVAPNDSKKQLGWVAEAPPFQYDNWLQNRQDQMLAHINQRGIPAWDGLTNYEAGGLSYAQGSDGKIYKSIAASGPTTTIQNPTTDVTDTYWTIAFADVGAFLTQTAGDARYTRCSNNLSDVSNTATAFSNIKQAATDTVTGVVELATIAEVQAGTDTTRAVTAAGVASVALGMGQTWQNVIGSRVAGTTYTNTAGRPIFLAISVNYSGGSSSAGLLVVNGVTVATAAAVALGGATFTTVLSAIVPSGGTYLVSGLTGATITVWAELR